MCRREFLLRYPKLKNNQDLSGESHTGGGDTIIAPLFPHANTLYQAIEKDLPELVFTLLPPQGRKGYH